MCFVPNSSVWMPWLRVLFRSTISSILSVGECHICASATLLLTVRFFSPVNFCQSSQEQPFSIQFNRVEEEQLHRAAASGALVQRGYNVPSAAFFIRR
jgi:hypothetical protein